MYSPKFYQPTVEEDSWYLQYQEMMHLQWEEQPPYNYQSPMAKFKQRIEEDRNDDR
jgi:hypothetical protein